MLWLDIAAKEHFDADEEVFIQVKATRLQLEHSLVSVSKWESKWNQPFLSANQKTPEQTLDYVRCMTITQNVNPLVYTSLSEKNVQEVIAYINAPMTATVFSVDNSGGNSEIITSELIYYYMTALAIPFECQKWHLNRLLTLIRVCNIKNSPGKKMSKSEIYRRNARLNEERKAKLNTKG